MCHIVVFPSDQLAVPNEKHLHHRLGAVPVQGDDVLVLPHAVRDLLLLGHLLHTVVQIPIDSGILKIQFLRGSLHFPFQLLQDRGVVSAQKLQRLAHLLPVLFPGHISLAGSKALFDMVIQAGAVSTDLSGETPVAGPQEVKLIQQIDGILHCRRTGVGTEVPGLILLHGAGKLDPGVILPQSDLNVRVGLVVL